MYITACIEKFGALYTLHDKVKMNSKYCVENSPHRLSSRDMSVKSSLHRLLEFGLELCVVVRAMGYMSGPWAIFQAGN